MQIYINITASLQICHTENKLGWETANTEKKTVRFGPDFSLSDMLVQAGIGRML